MVLYTSAEEKIKPENKTDFDSHKITLERIKEISKKHSEEAYAKGFDGKLPTREERTQIVDEFRKKKGFI